MNARTASIHSAAIFLFALLGSGCATRYEVKVAGVARGKVGGQGAVSYEIRNKRGGPDTDTLRFKEASKHIKTALSAHGLYEAPDARKADMVVEVDYDIGQPRTTLYEYQAPIFGRPPPDPSQPRSMPTLESTPELVGYEEAALKIVVREKHLSVAGYDKRQPAEGRPLPELWRVDVSVEDEGKDLRGYLPLLASAAMDRIGRDTDGTMTITVRADDETVRFIRKGM